MNPKTNKKFKNSEFQKNDKFVINAKEELIEEEKANIEKLSSEIETIQKTLSSLDN